MTPARRSLAKLNATVLVAALVAVGVLLPANPLSQLACPVGLVVLLGAEALALGRVAVRGVVLRAVACCALGLVALLLVGAASAALLHVLGVARPLDRPASLALWIAMCAAALLDAVRSGHDPVRRVLRGLRAPDAAWAAALLALPALSLVGTARLNATGSSRIAVGVAVAAVALCALAVLLPASRWLPPRLAMLSSALLALLWQNPGRGGWIAGFDVQHELFFGDLSIRQGTFPLAHFVDPYGGMLSLTVWPAVLHALTGVAPRTLLLVAPSLFLVGCLAATWATVRELVSPRWSALLCALFVVGLAPFIQQMPQITRQCYALFFFSVIVAAVVSTRLSARAARVLVVAAGVGIAVTHYSTAYLTAGAVLAGCVLTYLYRVKRPARVLNLWVTASVVGVAAMWGTLVARTGSNLRAVLDAVRADGLQLLPGTGSLVHRWLSAATVGQLVDARALRAADLRLLATRYRWMFTDPASLGMPLGTAKAPGAHGVAVLGAAAGASGVLLAQLLLGAAVLAVALCALRARTDRRLAALTGLAAFFVLAAGVSRFSQTLGVEFDPSRVQTQAFLVFVAAAGVSIASLRVPERLAATPTRAGRARASALRSLGAVCVVALLCGAAGLSALAQRGGAPPAGLVAWGEGSQRLLIPADVDAARWVASNRPAADLVQADRFGQLALYLYGYIDRPNFVSSVDPVITDRRSWVFAYRTNVVQGIARGGTNARVGVFRFPAAYFAATRPILYVSSTDVVYGSVPFRFWTRAQQLAFEQSRRR